MIINDLMSRAQLKFPPGAYIPRIAASMVGQGWDSDHRSPAQLSHHRCGRCFTVSPCAIHRCPLDQGLTRQSLGIGQLGYPKVASSIRQGIVSSFFTNERFLFPKRAGNLGWYLKFK